MDCKVLDFIGESRTVGLSKKNARGIAAGHKKRIKEKTKEEKALAEAAEKALKEHLKTRRRNLPPQKNHQLIYELRR